MFRTWTVPFALGAIASAVAITAQAQVPSSALQGVVRDETGAPVTQGTVEIRHEPSGFVISAPLGANGRFSGRGLRVGGPYTVRVTGPDFSPLTEGDIFLALDQPTTLELIVARAAADEIVITASRSDSIFSRDNKGTGTTVSNRDVESLPTISRSINDLIRTDPRLTVIDKNRGEIVAAGQNNRFNNIQIDGVATNDPFGLNANGLPSLRQPISLNTIDTITVDIAPYDVEKAGFTGAAINAVTKSGTNELEGEVYFFYRDDSFVGSDERGNDFGTFEEQNFGFVVGGPIIRDQLFFFANYERFNNTQPPNPIGLIGSNAATIFDVTQQEAQRIVDIARNVYGYDPGGFGTPGDLREKDEKILLKLDANLAEGQRLSFRYNRTDGQSVSTPQRGGVNIFSLDGHFFDNKIVFENYVAQHFANWTPDFSTKIQLSYSQYSSDPILRSARFPQVDIENLGPNRNRTIRLGTEQFRHANSLSVDTLNFQAVGEYFWGDHLIKGGVSWERNDIFNRFVESSLGVYQFSNTVVDGAITATSLDNFEAGRPRQYTLRIGSDPNNLFPAADWSYDLIGLFIQDTWTVSEALTVQFGLRYDVPKVNDRPLFNERFLADFGFRNDTNIDGNGILQPRFGFNFRYDDRTQVRGGLGLFAGTNPNVWLSNPFTNPGGTIDVIQLSGAAAPMFSPDPDNQPRGQARDVAQDVDVVAQDFRLPSIWRSNLAVDFQLTDNWVWTNEANLSVNESDIFYTHENLGAPTGVLPDGRPSFYEDPMGPIQAQGVSQATARANRNRAFNDVILLSNTRKGASSAFTTSLERAFRDNYNLTMAYTLNRATNVTQATSSRAISNWNSNNIVDPAAEDVATSNYEIRHRFILNGTYEAQWFGENKTRFSAFLERRSGRPFSWTFSNDANGDRIAGNDLLYVPTSAAEVLFVQGDGITPDPAGQAAFFALVRANRDLQDAQGSIISRNSGRNPWITQLDLSITQELPKTRFARAELRFDMLNVTNLLDKRWGQIEQTNFPFRASPVALRGVTDDGRMLYQWQGRDSFTVRQDNIGESRWAALVGINVRFGEFGN